ncbi:MBL fold metallo-hydrolase RNA specificity domain-containing protein [Ferrovum sp. JA12]
MPVRASIHMINDFSAYADRGKMINWHNSIQNIKLTVLVDGD